MKTKIKPYDSSHKDFFSVTHNIVRLVVHVTTVFFSKFTRCNLHTEVSTNTGQLKKLRDTEVN